MSFLISLRPSTTALHRSFAFSCKQQQPTRSFAASPAARLARLTVVGRLADAPEIVPTSTGQDIVKYTLGTNHGPKEFRQTSWWKVVSFMPEGPRRDLLVGLGKGTKLYVEGDCSLSKYVNKEGTPVKGVNVTQRHFEILERKESGAEGEEEGEGEGADS